MNHFARIVTARRFLPLLIATAALAATPGYGADGDLDTSFDPGTGATGANQLVDRIVVQPNGKIIISGGFFRYNNVITFGFARVHENGALDTSFVPDRTENKGLTAIVVQPDGKMIIGGLFQTYGGVSRRHVARINADGSLDPSFNPGTGAGGPQFQDASLKTVALQSDGRILIGGAFREYNGVSRIKIARINPDGSLDASFDPGAGAMLIGGEPIVEDIAVQPDGKILVTGRFDAFNNYACSRLVRLLPNGSVDTSFSTGAGFRHSNFGNIDMPLLSNIALQADGKMLISGNFDRYNGFATEKLARINPDGSADTSFFSPVSIDQPVTRIELPSGGKIVIGGNFTVYADTPRKHIARLNPNGSLDSSFDPGSGANSAVLAIAMQADGKMIIGGTFTTYNGVGRSRIARVLSAASAEPLVLTAAVSRKTHGSSGLFDVPLALSGSPSVECRTGGATRDHMLVFTFNSNVVSGTASVTGGVGTVSGTPTFSGNTMTVALTGVDNLQRLTVSLNNVTNAAAQVLPNTPVTVGFLAGDTSGSGAVNATDIGQTKSQSGQAVTAANFRTDVTANGGAVSSSDVGLVKASAGTQLPASGISAE